MVKTIFERTEKKYVITGRDTGVTGAQFADYIMETIANL